MSVRRAVCHRSPSASNLTRLASGCQLATASVFTRLGNCSVVK